MIFLCPPHDGASTTTGIKEEEEHTKQQCENIHLNRSPGSFLLHDAPLRLPETDTCFTQRSPSLHPLHSPIPPHSQQDPSDRLSSPLLPHHCSECHHAIHDRFFVLFDGRPFHAACLRCAMCHVVLSDESSAFLKAGMPLCRADYRALADQYSSNVCSTCGLLFSRDDLVMRAGRHTFHVGCFSCFVCRVPLLPGDMCAVDVQRRLFCRVHFDPCLLERRALSVSLPPLGAAPPPRVGLIEQSTVCIGQLPPPPPPPPPLPLPSLLPPAPPPCSTAPVTQPSLPPSIAVASADSSSASLAATTRAKKEDSVDTDDYDCDDGGGAGSGGSSGGGGGRGGGSSAASRCKRMRTSFKHHQLRTMKNYFNLNHNPDAKDLKQLAQKTGLTKRVLQVWFQNARAKYRRSIAGRDPSSVSPALSSGSILLPSQQPLRASSTQLSSPSSVAYDDGVSPREE